MPPGSVVIMLFLMHERFYARLWSWVHSIVCLLTLQGGFVFEYVQLSVCLPSFEITPDVMSRQIFMK